MILSVVDQTIDIGMGFPKSLKREEMWHNTINASSSFSCTNACSSVIIFKDIRVFVSSPLSNITSPQPYAPTSRTQPKINSSFRNRGKLDIHGANIPFVAANSKYFRKFCKDWLRHIITNRKKNYLELYENKCRLKPTAKC